MDNLAKKLIDVLGGDNAIELANFINTTLKSRVETEWRTTEEHTIQNAFTKVKNKLFVS